MGQLLWPRTHTVFMAQHVVQKSPFLAHRSMQHVIRSHGACRPLLVLPYYYLIGMSRHCRHI
eukprot:10349588-Prorocentrum_lima.AAC.1